MRLHYDGCTNTTKFMCVCYIFSWSLDLITYVNGVKQECFCIFFFLLWIDGVWVRISLVRKLDSLYLCIVRFYVSVIMKRPPSFATICPLSLVQPSPFTLAGRLFSFSSSSIFMCWWCWYSYVWFFLCLASRRLASLVEHTRIYIYIYISSTIRKRPTDKEEKKKNA